MGILPSNGGRSLSECLRSDPKAVVNLKHEPAQLRWTGRRAHRVYRGVGVDVVHCGCRDYRGSRYLPRLHPIP